MKDLVSSVGNLAWWFTTVVMAIVVNILSAYLKAPLDRWISTRSKNRQALSEQLTKQRLERISDIRRNDRELILAIRREHNRLMGAILLFSLAGVILLTANVVNWLPLTAIGNLLAIVLMMLGMYGLNRASDSTSEISEAIGK